MNCGYCGNPLEGLYRTNRRFHGHAQEKGTCAYLHHLERVKENASWRRKKEGIPKPRHVGSGVAVVVPKPKRYVPPLEQVRAETYHGRRERIRDYFVKYPTELTRMLAMRRSGMSCSRLGREFTMDHTTIIYNLRRFAPELVKNPIPLAQKLYQRRLKRYAGGLMRRWFVVEVVGPTTCSVLLLLPENPNPAKERERLEAERQKVIDEDFFANTNPGKSYAQYRREGAARRRAEQQARTARLKAEYDERVRRRGRINSNFHGGDFLIDGD